MKCADHQDGDTAKLGYIQWHDKAAESARKGMKQRQCTECRRWYWPWEMREKRSRK